ncbi:MAG: hypothetical protein RLZZ360_512 [Candidatus Parcubacteria bacterium]|jgi:hypothetical protein
MQKSIKRKARYVKFTPLEILPSQKIETCLFYRLIHYKADTQSNIGFLTG